MAEADQFKVVTREMKLLWSEGSALSNPSGSCNHLAREECEKVGDQLSAFTAWSFWHHAWL